MVGQTHLEAALSAYLFEYLVTTAVTRNEMCIRDSVVAGSSDYNGNWIDWNRTVLEYLKNHADYIALHNYVENRSNDYYKFMATTRFAEKAIRITEGLIAEAMTKAERKDPIYIAFDEYNVWYLSLIHIWVKKTCP